MTHDMARAGAGENYVSSAQMLKDSQKNVFTIIQKNDLNSLLM